jgi:hypothetical protein
MMRSLLRFSLLAALLGAGTSSCYVEPQPVMVARPAGPCPGGVWVRGGYDRFGRWYPAHWRCPGGFR